MSSESGLKISQEEVAAKHTFFESKELLCEDRCVCNNRQNNLPGIVGKR